MPEFNSDRQALRHVRKKLDRICKINDQNLAQRAAKELLQEVDVHLGLNSKVRRNNYGSL